MESGSVTLRDETTGEDIALVCNLTERQRDMLRAGGLLAYTREGGI